MDAFISISNPLLSIKIFVISKLGVVPNCATPTDKRLLYNHAGINDGLILPSGAIRPST